MLSAIDHENDEAADDFTDSLHHTGANCFSEQEAVYRWLCFSLLEQRLPLPSRRLMFSKPTPRWITAGGFTLACGAGCVNAVGFLGAHHQALSHISGTVTTLGIEVAQADWRLAQNAFLVLGCFFLGCVISGLITRRSTLQLGRRYGIALMCEAGLLFAAVLEYRRGAFAGDYLAAMACGLQNAMVSSYSGAVIRTTHVTGIVTDLGLAVGMAVRRESIDWRRMRLYLVLLAGFLGGGLIGAFLYGRHGYDTLLFPAALAGLAGFAYAAIKHRERRRHREAQPAGD